MTCFRKSIRSFASAAAALLLTTTTVLGGGPAATVSNPAVTAAIERAVMARVGAGAQVSVSSVIGVRLLKEPATLVAVPEPLSRIGDAVRFLLTDNGGPRRERVGEVTATVHVTMDAVHARRDIPRGTKVEKGDVLVRPTDLTGRPFGPLPSLTDAIGARAIRDIGIDGVVTRADIAAEPLVRAGDIVRAHVRVGEVEVEGRLVAGDSGVRGDVIRAVNKDTQRAVRARVIGVGEVEVVNVP